MNFFRNEKAFTLVELLVVIAVTGLLSSIIFVIVSGSGEQGRIAKGLFFSQHLQNSLGSYALGVWNFDENAGTTANDISGWGNNGVISGASWTTGILGSALNFPGSSNNVAITNFGLKAPESEVTVSIWAKPSTFSGQHDLFWMAATGDYRITAHFPWDNGIIWQFGQCCVGATATISSAGVKLGEWNHFVFTSSVSLSSAKIYVNGNEVASGNITRSFVRNSADWLVGGRTAYPFSGDIDEVMIFEQVLPSAQIEYLYYAGLEKLLAKSQIGQKEYEQRLSKT